MLLRVDSIVRSKPRMVRFCYPLLSFPLLTISFFLFSNSASDTSGT